jgi:hypothetical protein
MKAISSDAWCLLAGEGFRQNFEAVQMFSTRWKIALREHSQVC